MILGYAFDGWSSMYALKLSLKHTWTVVKSLFTVPPYVAIGEISFGKVNVWDFLPFNFLTIKKTKQLRTCSVFFFRVDSLPSK